MAGELVGVVGRARQQDRRAPGALRDEDDRVQLHAVAHRDHHVALDVVEAVVGRFELLRRFARQWPAFLLSSVLSLGFLSLLLIGDLGLREGFADP